MNNRNSYNRILSIFDTLSLIRNATMWYLFPEVDGKRQHNAQSKVYIVTNGEYNSGESLSTTRILGFCCKNTIPNQQWMGPLTTRSTNSVHFRRKAEENIETERGERFLTILILINYATFFYWQIYWIFYEKWWWNRQNQVDWSDILDRFTSERSQTQLNFRFEYSQ